MTQSGNNLSWRTAKKRKEPSKPLMYLLSRNGIKGKVLDYGCGYGKDAEFLNQNGIYCHPYDPYFAPSVKNEKYDTVLCTYVLNVVDTETRLSILGDILSFLKPNGVVFITVRIDIKQLTIKAVKGCKHFTMQDKVCLPFDITYQERRFCIYVVGYSRLKSWLNLQTK